MKWPSIDESVSLCMCLLTTAIVHAIVKCSIVFKKNLGGGGKISGSGSKFNCAARVGSGRVGSDDLGYGYRYFSLKPMQNTPQALWVHVLFMCMCLCAVKAQTCKQTAV